MTYFDDEGNTPFRASSRSAPQPARRGPAMGPFREVGPAMGPFAGGFPNTRAENSRRSRQFAGPGGRTTSGAANTLMQQVSRMGVDPRSPQGQEIIDLLSSGYDMADPMVSGMVGDLVAEYQETLIGPLTRNVQPAPGDGQGPFSDREGNQFGYTAGDAFAELDNLSTENLARIQGRLVGLGLLDGYIPGKKDPETQKAFGWLLQMANTSGHDWARELSSLEQIQAADPDAWDDRLGGGSGSGGGEPAPFIEEPYLAPDYAFLAQGVKDQMRQALGRDPDDSEIAQLTAELDGWYKAAHDEEVEAARRVYEMQVSGEGGTPEAGRQIDPMARFKEMFESRYAPGIKNEEMKAEVEGQQGLVQGTVSTLSQMAGGMG